jgi:hypothetical protein
MIANISPSILAYEDTLNTLKYADRAKSIKTIVERNVTNVKAHVDNYQQVKNQLKTEIFHLKNQLQEEKSKKKEAGIKPFGRGKGGISERENGKKEEIKQYYPSEKIKKMKLRLNIHFEKELKVKKKIFELEQSNENLGFVLFSKQLQLSKRNHQVQVGGQSVDNPEFIKIRKELQVTLKSIDENTRKIKGHLQNLQRLEQEREKYIKAIQKEMLNTSVDQEAFKLVYGNALASLIQVDYDRNNAYARYQLRQRENYIEHLREELILRYIYIPCLELN